MELPQSLRTLGLLLIAPSGKKHQTHDQIVEVQTFGGASKGGVDHLKPHKPEVRGR